MDAESSLAGQKGSSPKAAEVSPVLRDVIERLQESVNLPNIPTAAEKLVQQIREEYASACMPGRPEEVVRVQCASGFETFIVTRLRACDNGLVELFVHETEAADEKLIIAQPSQLTFMFSYVPATDQFAVPFREMHVDGVAPEWLTPIHGADPTPPPAALQL